MSDEDRGALQGARRCELDGSLTIWRKEDEISGKGESRFREGLELEFFERVRSRQVMSLDLKGGSSWRVARTIAEENKKAKI